MGHILFLLIFVLAFAIVYIRLLIPYVGFFARYMFNERVGWDKYIEKPRLVFYGTGLLLMHSSYPGIEEYITAPFSFYFLGNCLVFISGVVMSQITWSKKFKTVFIPSIKRRLQTKKNFNISITKNQLDRLYDGMVRFDLILINRTSKEDFINCFLLDWDAHDSKIYFRLDNPSCREFYELFTSTFPHNSLLYVDFFKNSNVIFRANGKKYNYGTIRNAVTSVEPKNSKDLKAVFSIFTKK